MNKKNYAFVFGALFSILSIFFFTNTESTSISQELKIKDRQTASIVLSDINLAKNEYKVVRVVDGDTIVLNIDGVDTYVRMIGLDTPETVDPRKKVQCFGLEASAYLNRLLPKDYIVRIEDDITQSDKDRYGRLLRYVYTKDTLVNEEVIQQGYGYEYTYKKPYQFQEQFKASENYAKEGKIGLWAPDKCNGKM